MPEKETQKLKVSGSGIANKLHAVQCEVERMAKTGRNSQQGYDYLTESDISETFKALLQKHRVFFTYSSTIDGVQPTPSGKQLLTNVTVHYEFIDLDSDEKVVGYAAGQGSDATDKGVYKAITGAVKYIFMKTFLIPTGDDPERDVPQTAAKRTTRKTAARSYSEILPDSPPFGEGAEEID